MTAELVERLDGLDPVLVPDPGGTKTSTWRTHRRCLESVPDDASHLLVLQDDAWPCDNFSQALAEVVRQRPDAIVCLFAPGFGNVLRPVRMMRTAGQHWLPWKIPSYVPVVAIVYPAVHARQIPVFSDSKKVHVGRADDAVIAMYARAHKVPVWATVPSLVQHRDELVSVMRMPNGKGAPHRVAAWFDESGKHWLPKQPVSV